MRAGDYVRYIGPGMVPTDPIEFMFQVERWVNNFRHGDHNCSTWLFRPVYPETVVGATIRMPLRRGYSYGIACDYEKVAHEFKQHLIAVERGLRVAERLMKGA